MTGMVCWIRFGGGGWLDGCDEVKVDRPLMLTHGVHGLLCYVWVVLISFLSNNWNTFDTHKLLTVINFGLAKDT